ncbi:MAG: glycosyltransferase family 4 protein [Pseudomonadota bacterium]|nr:glycosyltransferase family 4 protein [Pseudomonadota bacterium]
MKTILQVIPSLGAGGAEQACVDVTAGIKAAGFRAFVVSAGGPRVAEIEANGGQHILLPVNSKNPAVMLANARWLSNFISAQDVDLVHARSRAPAWSTYLATRLTPCAFVTTYHAAYKATSLLKTFYNGVMVRSDRVIAISDFIARHIRNTYGVDKTVRTVPRGINLAIFSPVAVAESKREALRTAWGLGVEEKIILCPSRLSRIKGQKTLIEAIGLLKEVEPRFTVVILGDDQGRADYRHELEALVESHGLVGRVKIFTHCDDMPAAYSLASLVVAPSLVPEGFGRVPVEAMAMGVPVIATDLGGYRETVRNGETGWLVHPNDPTKLADAILQALHQTEEQRDRMRSEALRTVREHYDTRKMVADTLAVYSELLYAKEP